MSIKQLFAGTALAVVASLSTQAADVYVGLAAGASRWSVGDEPGASIDKSDAGGKITLGVQFHPNFALEGGYVHLGKAKYQGAFAGDIKGTGAFVDAVGQWPLTPEWSALARMGVFNGKAKGTVSGLGSASDSGTDLKYGLGLQYALFKTLAVRAEWERYRFDVFNDKGDVDLWSLGLRIAF